MKIVRSASSCPTFLVSSSSSSAALAPRRQILFRQVWLVVVGTALLLSSHHHVVVKAASDDLDLDTVAVLNVNGEDNPRSNWRDSYSVGNECYCITTFDHGIGEILVDTAADGHQAAGGIRTVREICQALGEGPGQKGRPVYNDIQCGNGPPNDAGDEVNCPGRVDNGSEGW